MITKEQLGNLKKGDKLLAEVSFVGVCKDNDLACEAPFTNNAGDMICSSTFYHPSCLSLPPAEPKYDPCRRFKAGDKVRIVQCKGRDFSYEAKRHRGKITEVLSDEDNCSVEINILKEAEGIEGITIGIDPAYLELITPVEELEPYSIIVKPEGYHCVRIMKGTKIHSSIPFDAGECVCRTLEEAKAAAEEERDRLNAKHGKEGEK